MQPFDFDAYMANRATAVNKLQEIDTAAAEKQAQLNSASQEKKAELDKSWSGRLGLDPGSFLSNRVNDAASLVSGASRLAGQVASLPVSLAGGAVAHDATPEDYEAYNRTLTGAATPEDWARLNQRTANSERTVLEGLRAQDEARLASRQINDTADLTGLVDQTNRQGLNKDLAEGFGENWDKVKSGEAGQVVSGLGGLIANAGSALAHNPSAVREYVLENAPQLFVGALGKAGQVAQLSSNVGYAVDEYQKGIENYQKANGGQLPPEDVRQKMALQAASLALAEQAGDVIGLGATKLAGKAVSEGGSPLLNVGKAAAKGFAGEAPTEGFQTYMEGQIEGKPAGAEEIYAAGVIGGASGGALSGGGRVVHEAVQPAAEQAPAPAVQPEVKVLQKQAQDTGDVSALADAKSKTYAPDQAIAALYGHSQKPDTTDEAKAQNLTKAGSIVSDLEARRASLVEQLATPEEKKAEIQALKRQLTATPADKAGLREALQDLIKLSEDDLANPMSPDFAKKKQAELAQIDRQLAASRQAHGLLKDLVSAPSQAEGQKLVEAAETDTKAVERVINLSMSSPEALDPVRVRALADNKSNALTTEQRAYLRQFAQARIEQNKLRDLNDVGHEIVEGSPDNLGLKQYQSWIGSAVSTGDKKTAGKYLALLQNFAASHVDKARKVLAASAMKGDKHVARLADGGWEIRDGHLPDTERQKNGAVNVKPQTRLGQAILKEAAVIALTADAMQAAYATRFKAVTTGAADVQNVPPQGANPGSEREAAPVQADGKAGPTGESSGTADTDAAARVLEAAGVITQRAIEDHEWLANPPADYTTEEASKRVERAKKQLPKVEGNLEKANQGEDFDLIDALSDARAALRRVIEKGEKVLEGDRYDAETSPAAVGNPRFPKSVVPGVVYHSTDAAPESFSVLGEREHDAGGAQWMGAGSRSKKVGFYTTKNRSYSESFGKNVIEFYVNLTNPYLVKDDDKIQITQITPEQRDALVAQGYDGLLYADPEARFEEVVVFRPDQVARVPATEAAPLARTSVDSQVDSQSVDRVSDAPAGKDSVDSEDSGEITEDSVTSEEKTESTGEGTVSRQEGPTGSTPEKTEVSGQSVGEVSQESDTFADASIVSSVTESPEGTAYQSRNLVRDFFKQTASREGDKTQRPLAKVKDFLSGFSLDKAVEFLGLKSVDDLSDPQKKVLTGFQSTAERWFDRIRENLAKRVSKDGAKSRAEDFYFNDMMQFLLQDTDSGVDVAENLKTAMAYAAYSWIAENASRSPFNDDATINAILDRDENTIVEEDERNALRDIGIRQNVVVNTLGQRVAQALGLKAVKGAPQDLQARLESAIGAHVFKMLMDEGLVERTTKTGAEMSELLGSPVKNDKVEYQFVKLARDEQGEYHPEAVKITSAMKGTQNVLDKLFSVEPGLKEPSLEPIPFDQATTKNTRQQVPEVLAAIMQHENDTPFFVRQDMWALMQKLSDETLMGIAGAEHVEGKHIYNVKALEAGNDGLKREIERFREFVGSMADVEAGLYFEHVVWKQQRVGIATNVINPQTSKVHRHMLYRQSWDTEINPAVDEQLENFMLRVAEGLGVKTDKKDKEAALTEGRVKRSQPEVQAAVAVLKAMIQGEDLSQEQQQALIDGVKAGGEAMHTLDALMALAHYELAEGKPFHTQLMGEVDGVTNGPMLTHLLLGAADNVEQLYKLLNRGGFYQVGSDHSQYNLWRGTPGNLDLYETTTRNVLDTVAQLVQEKDKKKGVNAGLLASVYAFTGMLENKETGSIEKAGRNIIKTPLTAMVFGSSVPKAIKSMASGFVESIYDAIEQVNAGTHKTLNEQELLKNLNTLLMMGGAGSLPRHTTVADLMNREFYPDQVKALMNSFQWTLGKAVKQTMEQDFGVFIKRRQQFNDAAQLAFEIHNAAYEALREAKIAELIASGEMAFREAKDGTKVPIHDLTTAQEAEIRKTLSSLTPVMHTPLSKESKSLAAGLNMSKSDRRLSQDPTYQQEILFGSGFPDTGAVRTKTNGWETVASSPGVAMNVMSTHSADSAISHHALDGQEVLNVHDAHGTGLGTFAETAERLNHSTWNVMLGYSSANEVFEALARTVRGFAKLAQEGKLPTEAVDKLARAIEKAAAKEQASPSMYLEATLRSTKKMAHQADDMKLQAMERMQAVDQYALQGGNYLVTEADRAQAAAQRQALQPELGERDVQAVEGIVKLLENSFTEEKPAVEQNIEEDERPVTSPFGDLGTPALKSDPELVSFFKANPKTTVAGVIRHLYTVLKNQPESRKRDYYLQLLQVLNRTTDKGLSVTYITKDSPRDLMKSAPPANSHGWYNTEGEGIFVLSPDFVKSALVPELLLHEMTHNALVDIVDQAEKGNATKSVIDRVNSLKGLLKQAQDFVKGTELEARFKNATGDIHEFLAWGMTNQGFQREVLAQIQVAVPSKQPISAWKKFVQTVTDILFQGSNKSKEEQYNSAMAAFLADVSALFAQVEQAQIKASEITGNLSMAAPSTNTYSTLDIFEALDNQQGDITPAFADSLRGLLGSVVNSLHGPFGTFKAQLMQNTTDGELGVWFKAMFNGKAPFASKAIAAGFRISSQELFAIEQVEATVRAAMDGNEAQTKVAARELADLYQQVYQRLKPADFEKVTGSPAEAKALYDFVFKMEKSSGDRSDYLARFASLALGHQGFNSLLKVATTRDGRKVRDGKSFAEKVQIVFENILGYFRDKVTSTFTGQLEDAKVKALVEQLVDIEAKQREKLANPAVQNQVVAMLEEGGKNFAATAREAVAKVLESRVLRKSGNGFVQLGSSLGLTVVRDQVDEFFKTLVDFRDKNYEGQQGVVAGMLNELRGPSQIMEKLLRMRKRQEGERKDIITGTVRLAASMFKDGKDLPKKANAAITQVLLRTGAHTLLELGMPRLEALLTDRSELESEIAGLEAQLPAGTLRNLAVFQAKALGFYKATGVNRSPVLQMNAHNIARMLGTPLADQVSPEQAEQMEPVLDKLVSLYGLAYSDDAQLKLVAQTLATENQRTDGGNGVEFALRMAARLQADALERTFRGNKTLMVHGYTPEIYNPHTEVVTANEQVGKDLMARGYTKGEEVRVDPHDPVQEKRHIYVLRDGGLQPWLSGIQSMTGVRAKGSEMHSGYLNLNTQEGLANAQMNAAVINARQQALQKIAATGAAFDPKKDNQRYMAPVFNEAGEIVNWRDLMLESTKDTLLERDNRFEMVLGKLAGSVFDRATAKDVNRLAIEAAKRRFDAEYKSNPDSYMLVGSEKEAKRRGLTVDPELAQVWNLLPSDTQQIVREVWGNAGMMVRKDELDIMFGYRKLSLADAWDKDPKVRNVLEKMFVALATELFGEKAAMRIRQGERAWQEVVKEAKDIIVVKSGVVLLGNMWSNLSLLWLKGVPLQDMLHHHLVALKGATSYLDDSQELRRLKMLRDTGFTQGKDEQIAREILRLEDAIARNPVGKIIEAGLMPSIVDDVEVDDDIYSFKNLFTRTTEKYTAKLHPAILEAGKSVYLAHDTKLYKAMSRATQLSDFVARYTLYQHLTTKAKDPVSSEEALHEASESFINYDVPAHRKIQYGNDVGLLMFTKYFLRIQRVLGKAGKDNPLRYYAMLGAGHFLTLGPIVLESLWLKRLGHNPLRFGALDYPGTLGDLATVSAEMALLH